MKRWFKSTNTAPKIVVEQAAGLCFLIGGTKNPTWQNIEQKLHNARQRNGCVDLCVFEGGKFGQDQLQLQADRKNYLLTYFKNTSEEDEVYSLFSSIGSNGQVEILGDYWGSGMIGRDFSVVVRAFKEFYETGEIDLASYDVC